MRSKILATFVTLAALVVIPVTAFAEPAQTQQSEAKGKAAFPMPAAAFKQKVDGRITKARARMEQRASKLSADEAKQLRAKFDAGVGQVNQAVAKATADGTVTKDEAKSVRDAAKAVMGHKGKHGKHGKHGKKGETK